MLRRVALLTAVTFAASTGAAVAADPFSPQAEQANVAKSQERGTYVYHDGAYHDALTAQGTRNSEEAAAVALADPERHFLTNVCGTKGGACAGDVRLYDWAAKGYGEVQPVLFTARNGATLAGRVWATKAGPAKRPGIVIVNGSVQAPEEAYWWAAQTLAKAGYVVLTFDPQGQGRSDVDGESPDSFDGVPSQTDGTAFFDGAQDALDFLLSTPDRPYRPRPSRTSSTSHAAKQDRRVAAKLDAPYNPFYARVDPERIGIAGHSYGAQGASWVGQQDPRIDAVVAWDNLCVPVSPAPSITTQDPFSLGNGGLPRDCLSGAEEPAPKITKPALGINGDYVFAPVPHTAQPDAKKRGAASRAYTAAGVDTGSITIRGGTHLDFSFLPLDAFPATLRGIDLTAWYTTAWFDRYVKRDPGADRRLLSDRWRKDPGDARVDPAGKGNLYSALYDSRLDVTLGDGTHVDCEDLRKGCDALGDDGLPASYSVTGQVLRGDGAPDPSAAPARACTSRRTITLTVKAAHRATVRAITVRAGRKALAARRVGTRRVRVSLRGLPRTTVVLTVRAKVRGADGRTRTVTQLRRFRTCVPR